MKGKFNEEFYDFITGDIFTYKVIDGKETWTSPDYIADPFFIKPNVIVEIERKSERSKTVIIRALNTRTEEETSCISNQDEANIEDVFDCIKRSGCSIYDFISIYDLCMNSLAYYYACKLQDMSNNK